MLSGTCYHAKQKLIPAAAFILGTRQAAETAPHPTSTALRSARQQLHLEAVVGRLHLRDQVRVAGGAGRGRGDGALVRARQGLARRRSVRNLTRVQDITSDFCQLQQHHATLA